MIAIFGNTKDASDYSALVHAHLTANRPRYSVNTVRWSDENKHKDKNEFGVKLPPDLDKLEVKMDDKALEKSIRQDEKYADDWDDQGENNDEQ